MMQYLGLLNDILTDGTVRENRTGKKTVSVFGRQLRFNLEGEFPLVTTKFIYKKAFIYELLFFLKGKTNISYLKENRVHIWDEWADENGDLGPIYGKQWRDWGGAYDQIKNVIDQIKINPNSRRLIVSAWNVSDLHRMALPPCHMFFQFYVEGQRLSCQVYQRSADAFLGVPFNIASYALLTNIIAHQTGLRAKELIWVGGDCHLYWDHLSNARIQTTRMPREMPKLRILRPPPLDVSEYRYDDFKIEGYKPHGVLKAEVAV